MPTLETFIIEESAPGERFDVFLHRRYPALSRSAIQRLIEQGAVKVNGRPVKPTHSPRAGEQVEVEWPDPKPATLEPVAIPLDILYEDDCLVVINKPAGLVVHPAAGHETHTLVHALLHHCAGRLSGVGGVSRPGIVHRLDKDTSGVMVVAKTDAAHLALARQFAERRVLKVYHAIVCGQLPHDTGEIRAAIARHPSHRKCMTVCEERGREAHTSYRVLERLADATLVEARLHTGRTHQVRVHFQHLGHPLVGDPVYGRRANRRLAERLGFEPARQMLHATQLTLAHPRTGESMTWEAPWPADFQDTLRHLRAVSRAETTRTTRPPAEIT
ncbi:RluA family pseudouridine synthase [Limisphaera ngatamarikiensis]|uniref:Pseudouridine synthase n=1 Tax=Limisphaera ngatamarikiensis TaxID=1324935 RepID=A0A6M1RF10_9BACT|nr:RluA family pseudouridine synthase [Limisphaera ngatamarikiensis]NGO38608.1 RluA family pseudouridine synthase [Limisphaera ngatamarikiensis]